MNESSDDRFDLERFVVAQDPVWRDVVDELTVGRKTSHWMWFVFPQIEGLGSSPMAQRYAIASLDEAKAYLDHPTLGARLREGVELMLGHKDKSAREILDTPDDMKFRSCLTLFVQAAPEDALFADALDQFYDGFADEATLQRLSL